MLHGIQFRLVVEINEPCLVLFILLVNESISPILEAPQVGFTLSNKSTDHRFFSQQDLARASSPPHVMQT
jgi:hypothetical protein